MTFLIQQTLIYAVPLMIVALAGVFAERSGIINLALEGIMIFGAFAGAPLCQRDPEGGYLLRGQGGWGLGGAPGLHAAGHAGGGHPGRSVLPAALLCLGQPEGGPDHRRYRTEPDGPRPGAVLHPHHRQPEHPADGGGRRGKLVHAQKSFFGYGRSDEMGFFGDTFINKAYLATYICIILFVVLSILLYKTRFGLRLRSCGENPQAADSPGHQRLCDALRRHHNLRPWRAWAASSTLSPPPTAPLPATWPASASWRWPL